MPESMSYPDPNYLRPMPNFNKSLHVTRYPQLCNQMFASQLCRYLVSKGTMLHGKIRATRFRKHVIALSIRRSIDRDSPKTENVVLFWSELRRMEVLMQFFCAALFKHIFLFGKMGFLWTQTIARLFHSWSPTIPPNWNRTKCTIIRISLSCLLALSVKTVCAHGCQVFPDTNGNWKAQKRHSVANELY